MKLLCVNLLFLCMIALSSPFVHGASPLAESDRSTMCAAGQPHTPPPLAEESLDNRPIILAGAERDQCWCRCNSDLQSCVSRCPGFDENNVVDPKYAYRKCKTACDAVLSQCKSGCPAD